MFGPLHEEISRHGTVSSTRVKVAAKRGRKERCKGLSRGVFPVPRSYSYRDEPAASGPSIPGGTYQGIS